MLSVGEVAARLEVSDRRVRALIAAGRLPAERVGRSWVIAPASLAVVDGPRAVGRPLSVRAAWRELFGVSDPPEINMAVLRARYRRRARRMAFDTPDVAAAVDDRVVVFGGWAAAMCHDRLLDEDVAQREVIYVGEAVVEQWAGRHWAVPSESGPIVVRVVGDEIFARLGAAPQKVVPARVAAVDLAEMGGVRVLDAALSLWPR